MDKKGVEACVRTAALAAKFYVGTADPGCPPGKAWAYAALAYCAAVGTSKGSGALVAAVFRLATPGGSSPRK